MKNGAIHCKHGHPWTEENTYITPKGKKTCRTCKKQRNKEHMQRLRNVLRKAGLSSAGLNLEPGWRRHFGLDK